MGLIKQKNKKSAKGYYYIYRETINGKETRRSTGCTNIHQAQLVVKSWQNKLPSTPLYISDLAPHILKFTENNYAKGTHALYKTAFSNFIAYLPQKPVCMLSTLDIENYKALRQSHRKQRSKTPGAKLSREYINMELRILKSSLNMALNDFKIISHISCKFKFLTIDSRKPCAFTDTEISLIENNLAHTSIRDIFTFCRLTGCRISEALNLQLADIDTSRRLINIRCTDKFKTKNRSEKSIPYGDTVADIISRSIPDIPSISQYLFHHGANFPYEKSYVSKYIKSVIRKLNLSENLKFHSTRHTFATKLAEANTPPHIMQELLGHKSFVSTQVYLHTNLDAKQKAIANLK
jgi:integrase